MLTYQDYLRSWEGHSGGSEAGGNALLSEDQFNALDLQGKFNNTNLGLIAITPGDPRYEELAAQTGAEPGRRIWIEPGRATNEFNGVRRFVDPSRVVQQDGYFVWAENNETPEAQATRDHGVPGWFIAAAAALLGGAGMAGAFGAGATTAGNLAAAPGMGFGTVGAGGAAETWLATLGAEGAAAAGGGALGSDLAGMNLETLPNIPEPTALNPMLDLPPGLELPYGTNPVDAAEWFGGPGAATNPSPGLFGSDLAAPYGWDATEAAEWFGGEGAATNPSPGLFGSSGGTSFLDTLLGNAGNIARAIPGIASALGGSQGGAPGRGGGGGGGGGLSVGGGGGGSGGRGGGRPSVEQNPYSKQKLTDVGAIAQYLRGAG